MSFLNKVRQQKYLSFTVILFTLSIGILIGTVLNSGVKANSQSGSSAPGATPLVIPEPVQLQNQFTALAKLLEPSVVNISTEYDPVKDKSVSKKANPRRRQPVPNGDEEDQGGGSGGGGGNGGNGGNDENSMQQFFQRYFGGGGGMGGINPFGGGPAQEEPRASLGSGVIVDKNGYILTNNHVVEKATRMKVKFNGDDTEYEAKLIGTDPLTDLAVIHINKTGLTPAKIGNSDAIQVGDWAVAIGSPFGFQATVTAGIISAKQRRIAEDGNSTFQPFLQTDAAINPGNSGGPLLNINGEVIGINTMIASRSGGYQGIGFAMPINTAVRVYNEIIKTGHVTRGSIGISLRETPDRKELLKAFGAKNGVFVEDVTAGGPAEKAGLKVEDIITSVNGKMIKDGQDLIDTVSAIPVGSKATLQVLRDRSEKTYEVTVGDREKVHAATLMSADRPPEEGGGDQHLSATQPRLGITFKNLTDGMRTQTGFKGKGGVIVDGVEPDSFADSVGLIKGDVVQSIVADNEHITINSLDDVKQISSKLKAGESVALKVMRHIPGGPWQPQYLAGTVPAAQ
jgi:serine protease Do